MKNTLILSLALALLPSLVWAQESTPEDLYLAYTLRGGIEITTFEIGSRIQLWEYGQSGKRVERIVDVIDGFVVLEKSGPIPMENIRQVSRLSDWQKKQIRTAQIGSAVSVAAFFGSIALFNNSFGVGETIGALGGYMTAALAPSLFAAQFLVTRRYRSNSNYYFTKGPLEAQEMVPEESSPISRPPLAERNTREYVSKRQTWATNMPRIALSLTSNGDGSFAPQIEYLLGPRFNVGLSANPLFPVSFNVGGKYYFSYYEPKKWNVYYSGKIGVWNSLFRLLEATGGYGGVGIERYNGKKFFWSAQLGAWIDPFSSDIIPEVSGSIGIRFKN
ncbi:MAG: hypothetical protein AAFQ98_03205 [Bacteroidota bacterium]